MICVGIDVASKKHDYFMLHRETGTVFKKKSVTVSNTEQGYEKLRSDIESFSGATGDSDIRIGLESTGIYSTNIMMFLHKQKYKVMMINPILTNMTRKTTSVHAPKNDNIDAQTICKYVADNPDKFTPYTSTLYHKDTLKSLSRKRFLITNDLRKAKLAVNNLVQLVFPELRLFSGTFTEVRLLRFLRSISSLRETSPGDARIKSPRLCTADADARPTRSLKPQSIRSA